MQECHNVFSALNVYPPTPTSSFTLPNYINHHITCFICPTLRLESMDCSERMATTIEQTHQNRHTHVEGWSSGRILTDSQRERKRLKDRIGNRERKRQERYRLVDLQAKITSLQRQLVAYEGTKTVLSLWGRLFRACKQFPSCVDLVWLQDALLSVSCP